MNLARKLAGAVIVLWFGGSAAGCIIAPPEHGERWCYNHPRECDHDHWCAEHPGQCR